MGIPLTSGKMISVFTLVMINVIAIDNLRSLTAGAEFGFALVFFYVLAAILFFIPSVLVTAELATGWPEAGGIYIWVREAFGSRFGFLSIWLQWIYNVVWYPTIFTFIAGIIAYLISPSLVENKIFMLSIIISVFWLTTLLNCMGIRISSLISILGALIGTLFPMFLIISLGIVWLSMGKPSHVEFSFKDFFPDLSHMNNIGFLTNILFGLMGIEMSAVHAADVKNPRRDYPKALFISALIILMTLVFACLSITIVVPREQLNLVSGLMDAYSIFFNSFQLSWCIPLIAIFIIFGSLACASAWILGPARGLLIASIDNQLPAFFRYQNKKNMPVGVLISQGFAVTLLCLIFFLMPSVSSSYWILSNLTAQLALIFYILMFASAIRLRYKYPYIQRSFKIPGGQVGVWIVCGMGIFACVLAILLGFVPPSQVSIGNRIIYEIILTAGIVLCILPAFSFISRRKEPELLMDKEANAIFKNRKFY